MGEEVARKYRVRFMQEDVERWVAAGMTLLDAALEAGVAISHVCGGIGSPPVPSAGREDGCELGRVRRDRG